MPRLLIRRLAWTVVAFVAALVVMLIATAVAFAETPMLSAPEAAERLANQELVLLDIRSPEEWAESGVAEGAWPVSMHTPEFANEIQAILAQYAPEQIGLICATGGRSAYIADILEKNGIVGVQDVSEGMHGNGQAEGWIARGMPVVTAEDAQTRYQSAKEAWQ